MTRQPVRLVVMGVSGSGKSTFAAAIGKHLHLHMVDGDDLHLPQSVEKMSHGIALTDADRWPWLDRVADALKAPATAPDVRGCVVACSALKQTYRDRLRAKVPGLRFIFLQGDASLMGQRMAQREGHFMLLQLLDSQLKTLETPSTSETDVCTVAADQTLAEQIHQVTQALQHTFAAPAPNTHSDVA